jgi:hypothetical protein
MVLVSSVIITVFYSHNMSSVPCAVVHKIIIWTSVCLIIWIFLCSVHHCFCFLKKITLLPNSVEMVVNGTIHCWSGHLLDIDKSLYRFLLVFYSLYNPLYIIVFSKIKI